MSAAGTGSTYASTTASGPTRRSTRCRRARRCSVFGVIPPSSHTKTLSPQRRPAHLNTQSNIIRLGTPRTIASTRDVSPIRARAPMLMIDAVEPRRSSRSAGWDETSAGISGSRSRGTSPLSAMPAKRIRSARSGRPSHGNGGRAAGRNGGTSDGRGRDTPTTVGNRGAYGGGVSPARRPPGRLLPRHPRLRVACERRDVRGQRAGRDVGERHLLGDRPQARAHGDPHLRERLGRGPVRDVLRPLPAHRRERPLDGADHVGDRDLRRRPVQPVAALGAALAAHETGVAQVAEDVLEELERDALRPGDRVALRRPVAVGGRELHGGADGVVDLGGDAHRRALFPTVDAMPTTLETARLVGRPPQPGDVPALLALYGSVAVAARMYPAGRPATEAQLRPYLAADLAHWEAHGFGRFMWHERDTGEVVVRCGPKLALRGGRPELDMHWTVRVDRHRRGLAAEAAEAVVRACFDGLGARERHRRRARGQRALAGARARARLHLRARRRAVRP